jgi:phytoene dehydrogenase-like protein
VTSGFDVVVVGGGSNSLTTAAYLTRVGKNVLVLEENAECGGGAVSRSPAPGFIIDVGAVGIVMASASPVIANDELELQSRFGLQFVWTDKPHATLFDDGSGLITYSDVDRSCDGIARYSQKDADAYRTFVAECQETLPLLLKGYCAPPLPFPGFVSLLAQSAPGRRILSAMMDSAFDVVNSRFESDELKLHILKYVGELMIHPETKGTGIVPFLMVGISHRFGMGAVVGGTANLAKALERCIDHHGGTIRRNAEVVKINVSGGRATGVTLKDGEVIHARESVVANIHPWDLGLFLEGIDPEIVKRARNVKLSEHGAINQQIALSEPPIWKHGPEYTDAMMVVLLQRDLTKLRMFFDGFKYGRISKDALTPSIAIQSNHDKTRCPPGKATMYLYHFAPKYLEKGGLEGWDEAKQEVGDWIFDEMCSYATNMDRSKVIGRHIDSPLDHHRHSRMMRHGDILGAGMYLSQLLGLRPIPELAQYKVPGLDSFYLAGPTQHPGGGITFGGRATAMRMLMDEKIELSSAFAVI